MPVLQNLPIPRVFFVLLTVIVVRYFMISGFFYLLCFVIKKDSWAHRRIHPNLIPKGQILSEILWSLSSCFIFAGVGTVGWMLYLRGYTKVYSHFSDYGWGYFLISIPLLLFIHDTYFYFVHRLMHHRYFFRRVHKAHHDSVYPTPFASFSFHPFEALLEALILPVVVFVMPCHPITLLVMLTNMTIFGVVNHIGYELYPVHFNRFKILKLWLTTTHHQMHHRFFNYNYGLYFTVWDTWLKTEHPEYEKFFDEVKNRKPENKNESISPVDISSAA